MANDVVEKGVSELCSQSTCLPLVRKELFCSPLTLSSDCLLLQKLKLISKLV